MFSLRIVNVDSYQSVPTKGYDICYSEFRGCEIFKVPIIRIFGITPAGQKGCLHVHGVFPYLSIRCKDVFPNLEPKSLRKCMQELALDIDKALNVASRNSNSHRHHVYKIVVTEHIPFYGFHEKAEEFLKIYFYNPFDVSRTAELMTNGVILNKFIQPYEAHIPYILQFFIDYNLFGMNLINVSKFKFRASEDDVVSAMSPLRNQSLSRILDDSNNASNKIWNIGTLSSSQINSLPRQTVCELEADCCSSEIMNRLNESFSSGKNPGLLAIWEEEKQRRKSENDTSQITPVPSQERTDFIETESENFYKKKLRKLLESLDVFKICQKDKIEHMSADLENLSSPNVSDLSSTQDEEMLNMMLSLANSQSVQLDDDSILGFNHQNENQSDNVEDETFEMSQLFSGELEEMLSSEALHSDSDRNRTNTDSPSNDHILPPAFFTESVKIPQLDGAFDDEDHKTGYKKHPKKNKVMDINEESLIRSCSLYQPVVQLSPTLVIKTEVESPAECRPENDDSLEDIDVCGFINDDSSVSTPKRTPVPVCVPVSKNPHCSLIMNMYENSNDVSIEHTCTSRYSAYNDTLADTEDPSNIVFEVITNLIYKVECLTEGKASCYEQFIEEYSGDSCSELLLQNLNSGEKNVLQQIKTAPSDYKDNSFATKKENYPDPYFSLPIKKRFFNNCWNTDDQCESCSHSLSVDFSKIGKEIVLVKKLSESDLVNYIKFNSLKVVIPPLPSHLQFKDELTANLNIDENHSKSTSPNSLKNFKTVNKRTKFKSRNCDSDKRLSEKTQNSKHHFKPNSISCAQKASTSSSTIFSTLGCEKPDDISVDNESSLSNDLKIIYDSTNNKNDSKCSTSDSKSKISKNATDSEHALCNENSKESESDSKCSTSDSKSKISKNASDSEHALCNENSKESESDSKSSVAPATFEPVIIPDSLDFLISPKSFQSFLDGDDDSEITADSANSKEIPKCENSEVAVETDLSSPNTILPDVIHDNVSNDSEKKIISDVVDHKHSNDDSLSVNTDSKLSLHDLKHGSNNTDKEDNKVVTSSAKHGHSGDKIPLSDSNTNNILPEKEQNPPSNENHYISNDANHLHSDNKNTVSNSNSEIILPQKMQNLCSDDLKGKNVSNNSNHDQSCDKPTSNIADDVNTTEISVKNGTSKVDDSIKSESKKSSDSPVEIKKCATMSELRLYRRKKEPVVRQYRNPVINSNFENESNAHHTGNTDSTSIASRVREKNSSDIQIDYVGTPKLNASLGSASTCVPVVQLEPCKELIDKYCKRETDTDCLILQEVDHVQKTPPVVKEKRFFRTRVRQQKDRNLNANIINHTLGINGPKHKTNRFVQNKRGRRNSISGVTVQKTNGPILRKRSANFDLPGKKKLQPALGSEYMQIPLEKNSLEQVYDFESHLNADENGLNDKFFSRYSMNNKINNSTLKKNTHSKLSLKLNKKKNDVQDDYVPEYGISINSEPQKISRPRRTSSVVSYNEDESQSLEENQAEPEQISQKSYDNFQYHPDWENFAIQDNYAGSDSGENSDWSIDDIPISQHGPNEGLKYTITKKKNNIYASHETKQLPIPKFKVRKKKSLNVSIKLKKPFLNISNDDADFKQNDKSFYCISPKKKKKSKKKSRTFESAFDVKQKYKKHKGSRSECLKNAILQYCNSVVKNKSLTSSEYAENADELPSLKTRPDFYKPKPASYSGCSTPNHETSDVTNSPLIDENSDDAKRSKNSLKMKLKLKRITTRSNEERIVVVGKELEGVNVEICSESENEPALCENEAVQKPLNDTGVRRKSKTHKKTLGTKTVKDNSYKSKLKTKFKCPLIIENRKVGKSETGLIKNVTEENFKEKIPKFKPLLANISEDLLTENEPNASNTSSHSSPHKISVISPKKKSPLKNAELIKKELAQLNEMACTSAKEINYDADSVDLKCLPSEDPLTGHNMQQKLDSSKRSILSENNFLSPLQSDQEMKDVLARPKISLQRNRLHSQDFKPYFENDYDEDSISALPLNEKQKPDVIVSDTCKPCKVGLEKLTDFEIKKLIYKPAISIQKAEKIIACEPLIAAFPSPVLDSKSADSYIDPKKVFENLFTFSSPSRSHSPVNFNTFETSSLLIENDMSCGPFSNESSEHSKKEILKAKFMPQNALKPSDVFKSVERDDMGVLWNLAYFSPPQTKTQEKSATATAVIDKKIKNNFNQNVDSMLLEDLQKLNEFAKQANEISLSCNLVESESENSVSILNGKITKTNCNNVCNKDSKISFENILVKNIDKVFDDLENVPSFSQTPTEFEVKLSADDKSKDDDAEKQVPVVIKEEPVSDPVFEPMESLPNVRILDFQECLVESDSEMNPLLNDSEIDSVMSSADMILSNAMDTHNYEQCLQSDLSFDEHSLSIQSKQNYLSDEPKNNGSDNAFVKSAIDSNLQKPIDADLTSNNAIITAADTSSVLIPSYKNNTIPVLAINNPCPEATVNFAAFDEQSLNANSQFFPVMLTPVPLTDNPNYLDNAAIVVKENESDQQECVNFLEDNELLQSCSVSSTSDIENKNNQTSGALSIPLNGEEDILSMIVKSCDIGEEFDVNMNSVEETDDGNISSATLCNEMVDSNYIMPSSNFIISSQVEHNSFHTNSENAVSSSSENNLLSKSSEIVVIKTEPIEAPHIVYEVQDKSLNLNHTNKSIKTSEELGNDDNVLLDSMIHSFYGDDSVYGLQSSGNNDTLSLLCPTYSQSVEKHSAECCTPSFKSSVIKKKDHAIDSKSYKSDNYSKNISVPQNDSFHIKNLVSNNKASSGILSSSFLASHSLSKMSLKRYHFTPNTRPPTRDFIEKSIIEAETSDGENLNTVVEDSQSSENSPSPQITSNEFVESSTLNNTIVNDNESSLGSLKFCNSTKSTPRQDGKFADNSLVVYQGRVSSNLPLSHQLVSTPRTSNVKKDFPLPNVVVSPINKESGLTVDTNTRKRKLVFEDDADGPLKMLKSGREKIYGLCSKYGRGVSFSKPTDSIGNLSYSQIEGPTLENSRGFKVGSDNYGDAQVRHEVQHLTVMSLEIHVNTRNDLRPDPKFDSVTAIFYCIYNDTANSKDEEIVGMIVVDPVSYHQTSSQNSNETLKNYLLLCPGVKNGFIFCVENETALFEKLVKVIRDWDPDILAGYEIQMSSWGYLIERAEMLNINLRLLLSRLVDKNETKLFPIDHDPTVTDQTADLSRLNIVGRIVLCVWRLMRKEITLNVYSFENVYYHVLHKRTPLYAFHDLTKWFLGSQLEKVIRYYIIRVQGSIQLLEKLDVIGRTSELARLFGIQFYEVLSRGSQFRVESMMLRTAAPMSYIPVSPSARQRSHSRAPECVPLILEPESRFFKDPVVVLDFQSLYPSMIIAYNYCFSTCLGRVEHFGKNVPFEFGCTSLSVPVTLLQKLQNDIHVSPTGIAFVKSSVRRGILPSMLEEILNTRIMVKQSMKKIKDNNALKRLLDARQLGLKLIANVTYGYTGASFSGRMPSVEVADSIVGKGRETLERAIHMIENTSKWRAKVIYGDTDSLFILLPGRSKKQAFEIGQEIADAVTADNPKPVKLKFEKVYLPCVLETKKRYVGFMYETVDQENPVFDAKGIETVRRDSCPATGKILEKSLKILFKSYDVSLVKNFVQKQFTKLLSGRASIIDYIFAKEYRGISGYRPGACVPALEIAKKRLAKDPRSEPRVGERVPYVVVYGFPGLPIIQLVREPFELMRDPNLRINAIYYITRVISPPLERVFNLLGADVKSWYTNLARTFKPTLPMTRTTNQHRGTLSQYFVTLSCPSCEKPTFTAVCDDCREDLQGTTIALNEKIRQWERTVDHLTQICGSCTKSGNTIDSCISLDCPILFKLHSAKKDLSQAPYLRKVLAHELF